MSENNKRWAAWGASHLNCLVFVCLLVCLIVLAALARSCLNGRPLPLRVLFRTYVLGLLLSGIHTHIFFHKFPVHRGARSPVHERTFPVLPCAQGASMPLQERAYLPLRA